jgi:hypothetical protein
MALLGMPSYFAVSGSWTMTMPPSPLMALTPRVPSDAVPDKMTPMAFSCCSSERDLKKKSMGRLMVVLFTGSISWSVPLKTATFFPGGFRYT